MVLKKVKNRGRVQQKGEETEVGKKGIGYGKKEGTGGGGVKGDR